MVGLAILFVLTCNLYCVIIYDMSTQVKQRDQAHDFFLSNSTATYMDVAKEFEIPYDTIKEWGKTEGWYFERTLLNPESADISDQAERIRGVVFFRILEDGDGMMAKDLSELVKSWAALAGFSRPPEEEGEDRESLLDGINETD